MSSSDDEDVSSIDSSLISSRTGHNLTNPARCRQCAKLPFVSQRRHASVLNENEMLWDFEAGIYDLIHRMNHLEAEEVQLKPEVAARVAEKVMVCTKRVQRQLIRVGLLHAKDQNYAANDIEDARVVAPFKLEEINMGPMLGTGGFSSVYEIIRFELDATLSHEWHVQEARQYMKTNALKPVHSAKDKKKKSKKEVARYAIKHLRPGLASDPQKFERAAVDLALEAQLMLVMDHPNIMSVRGWSYHGPNAFLAGRHHDYFVIIDRLPELLEDRMFKWRSSLKRYHGRQKLPWLRKKFERKIDLLFAARLKTLLEITYALEYMHDRRLIHRDVKTCNMGFDVHGDFKIFDFGLSRLLPSESDRVEGGFVMSRVGTKYYMAPEIRKKQPYDLSADVYSFGIVFWEVLALCTPREVFRKKDLRSSRDDGAPLPLCDCWPKSVIELVLNCVSNNPASRPTISQVRESLSNELEKFGVKQDGDLQRRRSSFRFDLSQIDNFKTIAFGPEGSVTTDYYDDESLRTSLDGSEL